MKTSWPRVALALALWFSALTMQSIGLLHGYAHPHDGHARAVTQMSADEGAGSQADPRAAIHPSHPTYGWLQALFAGHFEGSAGCTLFDLLTHADLLHELPTLATAFAAPVHPDAFHAAWHHATQVTGFLARAPPAIG